MREPGENTPSPKETSHGLPTVSEATTRAISETYRTIEKWGDHLQDVKGRLPIENPHPVRFIERQVSKFPPQMHNSLFEIFVATIAVLEHQAWANKLSSQFDSEPPKK